MHIEVKPQNVDSQITALSSAGPFTLDATDRRSAHPRSNGQSIFSRIPSRFASVSGVGGTSRCMLPPCRERISTRSRRLHRPQAHT